jgi:hypothetical protein
VCHALRTACFRGARVGLLAVGLTSMAPAIAGTAPPAARSELSSEAPASGGDGSAGFVINGLAGVQTASMSNAGDVNGDGIDDVIIGASGASPNGQFAAGESYVVFGRTEFSAAFELNSLFPDAGGDGSTGFVLEGIGASDNAGISVSTAGDVNGDGIDDVIIGASGADAGGQNRAGESYVVFGRTTGFPAVFELRSLLPGSGGDGSAGFVLEGVDSEDSSGRSVSAAGDVNGDGIDDIIIGAEGADPNGQSNAGESYVVFGRTTGFPAAFRLRSLLPGAGGDGSAGFVLSGIDEADVAGVSVSNAGDVNGDGIDDLVIGAFRADPHGNTDAGESYVVFGRTTGFPAAFELRSLFPGAGGDGSAGFVLTGVDAGFYSGLSVSAAGDVNGDGIDDLIVGAPNAEVMGEPRVGESYVLFGRTTGFPAAVALRSLFPGAGGDGSAGVVLTGSDRADEAGYSVSGAGDVNSDGIEDLVVGAYHATRLDEVLVGESYVVFGRTTHFAPVFQLRRLFPQAGGDGSAGFVLMGIDEFDQSGRDVSNAGDINGDGIDDLIISAPVADPQSQSYVVFGRTMSFPALFPLSSLLPP